METMKNIILQEMNELRFNRKHIDAKIKASIEANNFMREKIDLGISLVNEYLNGEYYQAKMNRISQIKDMDIPSLVMEIFVGIAYFQREELFTSVTAQLASRLKFNDKADAIATIAEIVAVLCETDAFDINKSNRQASLMLVSRIPLEESLVHFILNSAYLPPMVCEPLELTHNYSSGYLTHNDSLVLGPGNHHSGDLCLDVLNTMNKVALKVDTEFLSLIEEKPPEISIENIQANAARKGKYVPKAMAQVMVRDALDNWDRFKEESYYFYSLLESQGNRLYFNHKVDKRGRIYCQGYHLSTQGTAFKKAMLEFADEEIVEGV